MDGERIDHNMKSKDGQIYNVCLMGASFETGNRGVSALAASLIKNVLEIKPEAGISLLIGNRYAKEQSINISGHDVNIKIVNYRLSPKSRIQEHLIWILFLAVMQRLMPIKSIRLYCVRSNPYLKAINDADFVGDIHGGDSFSDIYGLSRFIVQTIPNLIVLLMSKRLVQLPQTYGPYNSFTAKFIAKYILRRSYKILSRDKTSIDVISSLLGDKDSIKKVQFCPDVAFVLDSIKVLNLQINPPLNLKNNIPLVGLNVNGLMYNGGYTKDNMFGLKLDYKKFIIELIKRFMDETNANLLFIPHTFGPKGNINSDPDACNDIISALSPGMYKDRIYSVMQEYDQSEIKGIIGLCDFFIGSRMHACIAALSQEIPTVGVAYSRKFLGVFESIGVGDVVVDGRFLNTEEAVDQVLKRFIDREKTRVTLQKSVHSAQNMIQKTFQELLVE